MLCVFECYAELPASGAALPYKTPQRAGNEHLRFRDLWWPGKVSLGLSAPPAGENPFDLNPQDNIGFFLHCGKIPYQIVRILLYAELVVANAVYIFEDVFQIRHQGYAERIAKNQDMFVNKRRSL